MRTGRRPHIGRVATVVVFVSLSMGMLTPVQGSSASTHLARSPIYVGQIAPLTGIYASQRIGDHVRGVAGTLLALRQINKHGGINGRPLKLITADDQSTNEGGIAALQKLSRIDHVSAIIGPGGSTEILAMTPSIERAGIPMIIGGGAPFTTHIGDPWVFRTRPNYTYAARAQAAFAVHTLHLSRIALFDNDNATGKEIGGLQRADLVALGVTPVTEQTYPVLASDLTAQVLAIKKSGANALISEGTEPADYRLLASQMQQVGVHLTWVGDPIMALAALQPGAELLHGAYAATDYDAKQSPEAAAFNRALRAAFHIPASFPEGFTYDGMQILARVMRKAGTSPEAIRRGILAIRGYRGAMGTYNFDKHGDGLHQYTIVQNVNGKLRVVKVLRF